MTVHARLQLRAIAFFVCIGLAEGQTTLRQSAGQDENELFTQVQQLREALREVRAQLEDTRRDEQELRRDLDATRQQLTGMRGGTPGAPAPQPPPSEEQQMVEAKLTDLAQTKVSSGSKYRMRISGIALFNAVTTRGVVDQVDAPLLTQSKVAGGESGSSAATARQSQMTLEVFGPEWGGARTSGELSFDFFGGFPATPEGVSTGLLRLRTAGVTLDWKNTSLVAGQEGLFFSPRAPTSLATVAYPAFSSTGNLWTWTPQISIEHRWNLSERSKVSITGGLLDPLTGELPRAEYNRLPGAGEQSRIPAYASRLAWEHTAYQRFASVGAGAYYSRQQWQFGANVDSWAATADWELPLGPNLWLSGEAYRGRAIGGLGGGANPSVLDTGVGSLVPVDSAGGWLQLKFVPVPKIEFNGVFGEDHGFLSRKSLLPLSAPSVPIARNESGMMNFIYRPRSILAFSVEYRRLRTVRPTGPATADHVALAAGISF